MVVATARVKVRARRIPAAAAVAGMLLLMACTATRETPPAASHPAPVVASTVDASGADPSYDWHVLVSKPFGSLLKDEHLALHEVLLFHDASGDAAAYKDCYTIDGAPPRFLGRRPAEYLLCFDHDRLNRIEAMVPLPAGDAPSVFSKACARWLEQATSMTPSTPAMPGGTTCDGRDGAITFHAVLASSSGAATADGSLPLTVTLSSSIAHEP